MKKLLSRYVPLTIALVLLLAGGIAYFVLNNKHEAEAAWYNSAWTYRKAITIDHNKVSGTSTLSNFPMEFSITDPDLKYTGSGGKVGVSTGNDILFTSSDGTTKLDHELEKYASTTGETIAWVRIPTLATTTDTTIYVYFGNSGASDQSNKTGVWDSHYQVVNHLPDGTTLSALDSTTNAKNGTINSVSAGTGQIDGAGSFNGTTGYINVNNSASSTLDNWTMQAWINPSILSTTSIALYNGNDSGGYGFGIGDGAGNNGSEFQGLYGLVTWVKSGYVFPSANRWYQVAFMRDNGIVRFYVNGLQVATASASAPNPVQSKYSIGMEYSTTNVPTRHFAGNIDEARFSDSIRSADWLATEYNNQNNPSAFYAYGQTEIQRTNVTSYTSSAGANWYNPSWGYRKAITIDHNKVSGTSTLSNFPMMFSLTDPDLKYTSFGGRVGVSNGNDILFTSSDGTTKLDHELEKYASTTGETIAWVRIPTLSTTTDTTIYIYAGNSGASDQSNKTGVWDSNFKGVWHLPNGTTLSANDSTSNANNGTAVTPTATTGKLDGGASFNGTSDRIDLTRTSSLSQTTSWTLEAWTYANSVPSGSGVISERYGTTDSDVQYELGYSMDEVGANSFLKVGFFNSTWAYAADTVSIQLKQWVHIVGSWDGTTLRLYKNGSLIATSNPGISVPTGTDQFFIGRRHDTAGTTSFFPGLIDEVRISGGARTAGWIATEYNNQNNPTGFFSYGQLETPTRSRAGAVSETTAYSTSWYNSSFTKRQKVAVSGGASTTMATNYQVPVTVTYDSDMQSTFNDIRFTDSSNNVLDYWLERKVNSSTATFWVEVPTLQTTGASLYMYYGSTTAPSLSNLDNTFRNNSIYLETRDCLDATNCNTTDSHTEYENIITAKYGLHGYGYRTAVDDTSDPYGGTQENFFMRYRFLLKADTTGTWSFGTNSDDGSEVNLRNDADTASTTVLATWYGAHATGTCGVSGTPGTRTLTAGDVIFVDYRMNEISGGQQAQMCIQKPGGSFQTVNTTNFSGLLYARELSANGTEPTAVVGGSEESYGASTPMNWYSSSWGYRKAISIDKNKVSGNLTNFPMLFSVTDPDLKYTGSGGKVGIISGNDILFTLEDGVTKLSHEIESYSPTTGQTVAWVKLPQLSSSNETTIYVYFGNSGASNQQSATAVWDSNYKAVWHIASSTSLSVTDSTSNGYNGTVNGPTATTGKIGGAARFLGGTNNVAFSDINDFDFGINDFTVSYWAQNSSTTPHGANYIMTKYTNPPTCGAANFISANINANNVFGFQIDEDTSSTDFNGFPGVTNAGMNVWNYFTVTRKGTLMKIYLNGSLENSSTTLDTTNINNDGTFYLGQSPCPSNFYGQLDEIRMTNGTARSSDWIATEYNNQSNPGSFYNYGALSTINRQSSSGATAPPLKARGGVKFR